MSRGRRVEPSKFLIWAVFLFVEGSKSLSVEFAPQIVDHPSNLVVRWDQPATLNCRAAGNPVPTIEWYRNGAYVETNKDDATSQPILLPDGSLFFLRLSQKKGKSDEGVYNCLARNHLGTAVSKNASLYLEALEEEFQLHPSDLMVKTGERWLLKCIPPLGHPEPTISWKKNGVPVKEENGHYELSKEKLLVTHALKSDSGAYICLATNQAGERVSRAAKVTVVEKPTFTQRPTDVVASVGSTIQFICGIREDPTLVIQWHKENGELPSGRYEVDQENVLQIHHLTLCDAGKYVCTAFNDVGTIFAKASLTVEEPLDTRQKELDRLKDVPEKLMDIRVCLVNITAAPFTPAAHLHWKVTPSSQQIETYVVFYRSLLPMKAHWAEWKVPRDHQTIIPGLERGYKYEFKVRPYLGTIRGLDSNVRQLYIPEEVPSAAPQSISITVSRSGNSTITIRWEPPPPETHNGIIKGYQIWFLGNETHQGFNRTVDRDTNSLETTGLANGPKYCVKLAAINGAGIGVASNPLCGAADPIVGKMAKTPDFLSANYMLEVVRQPVFIASVGSALWIMLMVLAVYVCQQQAKQFGKGRQYALGEGLYRNASDVTIIKHRVDSGDSPWLSNTWKSTSGSKNYSTTTSLSSQLLWMESKDSQEFHKSKSSFDEQSQGSHIQTVPLVPDSKNNSPYGALYVDLPAKDLKAFYNSPLSHLSIPNIPGVELAPAGELVPCCHQNLRIHNLRGQGGVQQESWRSPGSLSPTLIIRDSWSKNVKKELQQVHSTPMSPSGFSADRSNLRSLSSSPSSGKLQRVHGRAKKVRKTYSSSKFLQGGLQNASPLPPPPPGPPGFQAAQDSRTKQECTCTCFLDPPEDFMLQKLNQDSLQTDQDSLVETQTFPTLPYSQLSAASIPGSLSDDRETVLTPEDVAEYLELSKETDHQRQPDDGGSATSQVFSPPHTYGYICGPLASELLENAAMGNEDDDDPNMAEGPSPSFKLFRSFCQTPSSSLSEDEVSLEGSLLNGWGSISEDNGTSTRCSLVSSSDGSFLLDANFAQALAVAVDSFCFGLPKKAIDRGLTEFLPPAPPLDGLLPPRASVESTDHGQQKLGSQPLPVWKWGADWVEEVGAKPVQPSESWEAAPKLGRGRRGTVEEAWLISTPTFQGVKGSVPSVAKGASRSDLIINPDRMISADQMLLVSPQNSGSGTFAVSKGRAEAAVGTLTPLYRTRETSDKATPHGI